MSVAPACRAASMASPVKLTTSSAQAAVLTIGAAASRIMSSRSSTVNRPILFGFEPTPTTIRSQSAVACSITSRWPFVIGSKEPEKKPVRIMAFPKRKRYLAPQSPASEPPATSLGGAGAFRLAADHRPVIDWPDLLPDPFHADRKRRRPNRQRIKLSPATLQALESQ